MPVTAEVKGNRIWIRSKARPIRALESVVPGAGFSKSGGPHWSVPLTMSSLRLLKKKFRDDLVLTSELDQWRRTKLELEKRLAELAQQPDTDLGPTKDLFPDLFKAMKSRPWQSVGAKFISEGRQVLIADTVGLGKTAQTLAGVIESETPGPYLVICTKSAGHAVWGAEISRWLPGHIPAVLPEGRTMRDKYLNRALVTPKKPVLWVIINPWMIHTKKFWQCNQCKSRTQVKSRGKKALVCGHNPKKSKTVYDHEFPQLFEIEWNAIIIDEGHKVLIQRTGTKTQTRTGAALLQTSPNGIRVVQTSTPFNTNPPYLYGVLNWLREGEYSSYWNWVKTYFEVERGYGDSLKIGQLKYPNKLARDLRSIFLRRTRKEVAPWLPERQYMGTPHPADRPNIAKPPVGIWLPMAEPQALAYDQMVELSIARLESGDLDAVGSLAELTRLRQFATCYADVNERGQWTPKLPSNKLDYLLDTLLPELNYPESPETKVVVISRFTKILELFAAETSKTFGPGTSALLTGSSSGKQRAQIKERFDSPGPPYVLFLNNKAGGESITLDSADEMVFLDEEYDADVQEQAEGRIDNRRPEEKVVRRRYRYLRSLDTVDEEIALAAAERGFEAQKVLRDGERFARKILGVS